MNYWTQLNPVFHWAFRGNLVVKAAGRRRCSKWRFAKQNCFQNDQNIFGNKLGFWDVLWVIPVCIFLVFFFSIEVVAFQKRLEEFLLLSGFELQASGVGGNCFIHCAHFYLRVSFNP